MRIALVNYTTRPRGGAVHTVSLAEALHALGADVTVIALGDPTVGFFRPLEVPTWIVPAPPRAPTLAEGVFRSLDALAAALASDRGGGFDVFHTQDCISARAAAQIRDGGAAVPVIRTVHHVDDFTTPALVDCQRRAILEPDRVLVVSRYWQDILRDEYGVRADVVHNGVDRQRFRPVDAQRRAELRRRAGLEADGFLFLAIGGIEPRKGSIHLFAALAELKRQVQPSPVLAMVGGHSFQDYAAYRDAALAALPQQGLELGRDVVLIGTVPDDELPAWYGAADAFVFPSLKEGWGLVVLEAMSVGLPVVATDIAVLREYLTHELDALLVPPAAPAQLAQAMRRMMDDAALRGRLIAGGREVAARFTWEASARQHLGIYDETAARA